MKHSVKKYASLLIVSGLLAGLVTACANMASPSGGAYDFDPPKVVRTSPAINAINVKDGKVVIEFDENVVLVKPSEKIIITPPQKAFPIIQAVNRRVSVTLKDTLTENTTYTIDFTDAITDNNEGNAFENFSFSFSTGDYVDTLAVSGKVLTADNLEPVKGMYVGLHSNLSDTAFTHTKFLRISRTNDFGLFTIRGVAPGTYNIYALDDANRDYMYDNPGEAIAFMDATLEPSVTRATRTDTTSFVIGDHEIDSIKTIEYTRFLPDDIVLRSFNSGFKRQYLQKYERTAKHIALYFGAPTPMPKIEFLNFDADNDWAILEKTAANDTLIYWLKDPKMTVIDTLSAKISYMKTDSLNQSVPTTDTLKLIDRTRPKEKKKDNKKKEEEEEIPITFIDLKSDAASSWDVYKNITFEFNEPIIGKLEDKIKFEHLIDTTFVVSDFQILEDSLNPRKFTLKRKWEYGHEYRISIDSASIYSIYGIWNNKYEQKLKIKDADQYGSLAVTLHGLQDSVPAFVQLLDKSDKPLRQARVIDNIAVFKNLNPDKYYARVVVDTNGNGKWDTGDYFKNLQPEMVYYFDKYWDVKANWEVEEDWTINDLPLDKQKPLEITKNKPQEKASKQKEMEQKDQKAQQQRQRVNSTNNTQNTQTGVNRNR
ncbi:Ig-like domain-containing domain [Dysgonomonas sp. ZJ279]|uniref:Ig-like domain-containing domain n=1 Tax=Dysgonomonas sp. ZJ279 TaxID=2709796 RepID=UPI0013EAF57B|nr:Ig-like domain-containing protein [Dysgonomonas sp. ZJ279]